MGNPVAESLYPWLREKFHSQRALLFCRLMRPETGTTILDVGGAGGDLLARIRSLGVKATFIVADTKDYYIPAVRRLGFQFVMVKEGEPLPFRDLAVDIVLSNSVIEHATTAGNTCTTKLTNAEWLRRARENQKRFADEIRRVGRRYFVQTPHKSFPVESHTWLPFVNWLRHSEVEKLVRFTNRWWVKRCDGADWNLLGVSDMKELFPDAEIHVERFFGLPKSIIAYRN